MAPGVSMRHSVIWPARAFMVTPTAGGIRVGGTVEMAGLDAPPDFRRARVLVRRAKEALPDLRTDETSEWMGHRPALPDTVSPEFVLWSIPPDPQIPAEMHGQRVVMVAGMAPAIPESAAGA